MKERVNGLVPQPHRHIKGGDILSPDTPVEDVRDYLLDPRVYGRGPRRSFFGLASRNYRSPMRSK